MNKIQAKLFMMLIGNLLLGLAVGIFIIAELGTDPFATMNLGISATLGLSLGFYQLLFNALLFIIIIVYGRHLIGLGTIVNMVAIGFIADFIVYSYNQLNVGQPSITVKLLLLLIGIMIASFGLSLYITAQLGVAPYDALPLIIMKMLNESISFTKARLAVDILAVVIGSLFGAVVGVGTLLIAVSLGPMVTFYNKCISEPFLQRYDVLVAKNKSI
ncbi:YczE/YyaS/YitT family protein [Amphibacillus cookii]|uniref:YczE/YyaS/YitT family protein n=1 Tax=Amphibacillus cookii TaxID=767787 RepID=UPI00195712AB|nr:membrane protein [Amphibacillus cookii]MBM7540321.1 putative membrane protein YczE [Amphibacillus cookii]